MNGSHPAGRQDRTPRRRGAGRLEADQRRQDGARRAAPIAVLGPTNTGKTHYAIERMLAYRSGMIGLPLRLLAREVYDRVCERVGAAAVALFTGEEKIVPAGARYWVCTVEAMPLSEEVECLAVDEIQLTADPERGRIFTSRLLNARGVSETLFLGSETMRPLLRRLFSPIHFLSRERFSVLSHTGPIKVTRLPRRSAIVAFSAETVYAIAELIRRQRGGAAVILGALSPRTRNAQAELYQSGEVDYLVATDAIGMGLNMDIDHAAFAALRKFDGRAWRALRTDELAQIAGRAGRYSRDGSFGVTAQCPPLDDETVEAIEEHRFEPLTALQWRSERLDYANPDALWRSLNQPPPGIEFQRARPGDDEIALQRLSVQEDIRAIVAGGERLELLWNVCETPDFRKLSVESHARLLGEIFLQLVHRGCIPNDWIEPRVSALDRADGDIDAISARIAHIRTWTYLSHRADWLQDRGYWQERARAIEDSLSDALHEKLTQRFVDRRTSVLLKKLKDDAPLLAAVTEDGEVIVEGHFVGRLLGFEFIVDPRASGPDARRMRGAAERTLGPELAARAAALANAGPGELAIKDDGAIWWRSALVARLTKGPGPLRPGVALMRADLLSAHLRGRIHDRLTEFLAARLEALLGDLVALNRAASTAEEEGLAPLARGVAFRLVENFGAMSRSQFGDDLKQLDQAERAKLRKLGVRFGEYTVFIPKLLKPAPAKLLTLLWALWADRAGALKPLKPGLVSLALDKEIPHAYYYASGYRPSGARAVRIDMLERLAMQIRTARTDPSLRGGFEATGQMMSLVGCSGEDFESILTSLGYRKQTVTVRRPASPAIPAEAPVPTAADQSESAPATPDAGSAGASDDAVPAEEAADVPAPPLADALPPAPESPAQEAAGDMQEVEIAVWRQPPRRMAPKRRPPEKSAQQSPRPNRSAQDKPARKERREGRPPQGGPARPHSGSPQHRRVADPNSPFAVLAGLKDELTRQQTGAGKPDKGQ